MKHSFFLLKYHVGYIKLKIMSFVNEKAGKEKEKNGLYLLKNSLGKRKGKLFL